MKTEDISRNHRLGEPLHPLDPCVKNNGALPIQQNTSPGNTRCADGGIGRLEGCRVAITFTGSGYSRLDPETGVAAPVRI